MHTPDPSPVSPRRLFLVLFITVLACYALFPAGIMRQVERLELAPLREPLLVLLGGWQASSAGRWLQQQRDQLQQDVATLQPRLEGLAGTLWPAAHAKAPLSVAAPAEAPPQPLPLEAPAPADAAAPAVPAATPALLSRARRILIAGDSMAQAIPPPLGRRLKKSAGYTLIDASRPSTGLVQPNFYDWPARLAELIEREQPDLVVLMLGANDKQDIRAGNGFLRFSQPDWELEYRARVGRLIEQATSRHIPVLWVGLPVMRQAGFDAGMRRLSEIHADEVRRRGQAFVPIRAQLADADGNYAHHLPVDGRERLVRASDGIHFSMGGAELLADAVAAALRPNQEIAHAP